MSVGRRRSNSIASTIGALSDTSNLGLTSNSGTGRYRSESNTIGSQAVSKMRALVHRSSRRNEHGSSSGVSSTLSRITRAIPAIKTQKQDPKVTSGVRYPKIEGRLGNVKSSIDRHQKRIEELEQFMKNEQKYKRVNSKKKRTESVTSLGSDEAILARESSGEEHLTNNDEGNEQSLTDKIKTKKELVKGLKKEQTILERLISSLSKPTSSIFIHRKEELRAKYQQEADSHKLEDYMGKADDHDAYQSANVIEKRSDKAVAMYCYYMLS